MASREHLLFVTLIVGALSSQPNIIVIISDDMGWNDVGFHGSDQVPTPNIDALAYHGIILNRHYTLPTCTPSRAAYLTGKYPIRTGMQGSPLKAGEPRGIPLSETLLPERLQRLGYVTRLVGKWHVGAHRAEYTPTRRGFHSHLGYWNGYIGYFDHSITEVVDGKTLAGHDFFDGMTPAWGLRGQYATDVFTREAVRIIHDHDASRPLYLHVAHLAVHSGNLSTPLEVPDPDATGAQFGHVLDPGRRMYAGMLASLDDSVGMVVTALADKGILNNSVILFMSDNGAPTIGVYTNTGSNWPLRGIKDTHFEGGVRTVCSIWSPMFKTRGTVSSQLVHISDWFPTFYTAAGGNVSDLGEIDGVDQWSSLLDQLNSTAPRNQVLINIDDTESIIQDNWKLVRLSPRSSPYAGRYGHSGRGGEGYDVQRVLRSPAAAALSGSLELTAVLGLRSRAADVCPQEEAADDASPCRAVCLFDLASDPCETDNLASSRADVVRTLSAHIDGYRSAVVPRMNRPVDPRSDPARHNGSWVPWLDYVYPASASPTMGTSLYFFTIPSALYAVLTHPRFTG